VTSCLFAALQIIEPEVITDILRRDIDCMRFLIIWQHGFPIPARIAQIPLEIDPNFGWGNECLRIQGATAS